MDASTKKGFSSKKEVTTPATKAEDSSKEEKKGPIKSFRSEGGVSVSIWAREYKGRVYHSCSFERSFKSAQGEWRYSHYFGIDELGQVCALAQQASDYLHGLPDHDQD